MATNHPRGTSRGLSRDRAPTWGDVGGDTPGTAVIYRSRAVRSDWLSESATSALESYTSSDVVSPELVGSNGSDNRRLV